jgi:hypothetical protein
MANQQPNEPNSPIKAGNMGQKPGQAAGQKPAQNPRQNAGQNSGKSSESGQKGGSNLQHGQGGVETQPDRAGR